MLKMPSPDAGLLNVGGIPCCGRPAEMGTDNCSKVAGPRSALHSDRDQSAVTGVTSIVAPWHPQPDPPLWPPSGARTDSTRDRSTTRATDEEQFGWDVKAQLLSIEQKIDRLGSRLDRLIGSPTRTGLGGIPEEFGTTILCSTPCSTDHKLKEILCKPLGDPSPLGSDEKEQASTPRTPPVESNSRDGARSNSKSSAGSEFKPKMLVQRSQGLRRAGSTLSANSMASHVQLHGLASDGRRLSNPAVSVLVFLEDPTSSRIAQLYAYAMPTLIVLSVLVTLVQTIRPAPFSGMAAGITESCFDLIFSAEIIVRFVVCPSRRAFLLAPFNLLDILSAVPPLILRSLHGFVVPIDKDTFSTAVLMLLVPVLRLLKTLRRFEKFNLILTALALVFEALPYWCMPSWC